MKFINVRAPVRKAVSFFIHILSATRNTANIPEFDLLKQQEYQTNFISF